VPVSREQTAQHHHSTFLVQQVGGWPPKVLEYGMSQPFERYDEEPSKTRDRLVFEKLAL
jgi:hypothetical protein